MAELRQLAYNTVQNNKTFCEEHNISPKHLETIYKVYYDSLVKEIFSKNKTKYYIYQNELGVFKNNLSGYMSFLKQWKIRLRRSNLKNRENPLHTIKLFRDKVYQIVVNEVRLQINYIEEIKRYIEYDRLTYEQVTEFNDIFNWVRAVGKQIEELAFKVRKIANNRFRYFENLLKDEIK
jgi:hypothetical protein